MIKYTTIPVNPKGNYTTSSEAFRMSDYRVINFFVETKGPDAEVTFKIQASKDGGAGVPIGFRFLENGASSIEEVSPGGKTITQSEAEGKTWQITVADAMLGKGEYDGVSLSVTEKTSGSVTSIFALQTQPRYVE